MANQTKDVANESNPLPVKGSAAKATGEPDSSKRRLIKGVAKAAPVVMAVSSKPALANFCTVSGFLSGNLSNHDDQHYCGGRSPGYWMNHVTPEMKDVTFKEVFGDNWYGDTGTWMGEPTLYQVLKMNGHEDRYQFGAHAVAAYQNALKFSDYPMSIYDVGDIVSQVLVTGYYTSPGTGQTLDAQQVVDFFYQTFDA